MKKTLILFCVFLMFGSTLLGQKKKKNKNKKQLPEFTLEKSTMEAHVRFLASDEMAGRRTGSAGHQIAGRYIAEKYREFGVQPIEGTYYQPVPFNISKPAKSATLTWNENTFQHGEEMLYLAGGPFDFSGKAVFANYAWVDEAAGTDDWKGLDVKGKVVICLSGIPNNQDPRETFRAMKIKREMAAEKGAVGLIEIYSLGIPWNRFRSYFSRERLELADNEEDTDGENNLPYVWVNQGTTGMVNFFKENKSSEIQLESAGTGDKKIFSNNIIGIIEGTDPKLKNEYILLSAHYDHVGVGKQGGGAYTEQDSIFNGTRDNAMGTAALLAAAEALAAAPPKRSVILAAWTAEEVGLLGSRYYSEHPLIPLKQTVFNLNSDGAGYADTKLIVVMGFDRVGAAEEMKAGCEAFGFEVVADPAPEQNLFDRSDNVNFAKKGIPAPTLSPGFREFGGEMMKYYHQVSDNPDSIDYDYLKKFCQAYAHVARLVANKKDRPRWKEGDKYEAVSKELYGR